MTNLNDRATDAQIMRIENPDTFDTPSKEDLDALIPEQHAKVSVGGERFWVKVNKIDNDIINGVVDNQLINTDIHGLILGDEVSFEKRHIYQIHQGD